MILYYIIIILNMSLNIIDPNTLNGNFCFNGSIFVKYNVKTGKNKYTEIFSHKIPTKNYKDLQIFWDWHGYGYPAIHNV